MWIIQAVDKNKCRRSRADGKVGCNLENGVVLAGEVDRKLRKSGSAIEKDDIKPSFSTVTERRIWMDLDLKTVFDTGEKIETESQSGSAVKLNPSTAEVLQWKLFVALH